MTKDNLPGSNSGNSKGRLDNPGLRILSILVVIASTGVLLYSLTRTSSIIPIMTGIFFLSLWFVPLLWKWIEFVFSKRPSSLWGRFTLNLVLAIIMASASEDILEIIRRFVKIILGFLKRML